MDQIYDEQELVEKPLAYNIPVSSNPFKLLDDESLPENNNNFFIKELNTDISKHVGVEIEDVKPLEKKKNVMSQEQERAFLDQFEKILKDSFPDIYIKAGT